MKLYQLHITPDETAPEGEDFDEYFTSLAAAKRRRTELVRQTRAVAAEERAATIEAYGTCPGGAHVPWGSDYRIDRLTLDAPSRDLVLRILNRRGYILATECVVPAHRWESS